MKTTRMITRFLMITLIGGLAFSCSPEDGIDGKDGIDGVQGPAGQDGAQGPAGQDGQNGQDGQDGNANVVASEWFESGTWSGANGAYYFEKSEQLITEEILNSGVVLAYTKLVGDNNNARPLPANTTYGNGSVALWNYYLYLGTIRFTTNLPGIPSDENQFRYVIIPSSTVTTLFQGKDVKKMNYSEVMNTLQLEK